MSDKYYLDMLCGDEKRLSQIALTRKLSEHEQIALQNFRREIERLTGKSQEAGHG